MNSTQGLGLMGEVIVIKYNIRTLIDAGATVRKVVGEHSGLIVKQDNINGNKTFSILVLRVTVGYKTS